jgi:hypothetical protein
MIAKQVPTTWKIKYLRMRWSMGNPREHVKDQGFWEGGASAHGRDNETAGRPSGFPGSRKPTRVGIRTDLEYPPDDPAKNHESKI